jgi:hypothetical protein
MKRSTGIAGEGRGSRTELDDGHVYSHNRGPFIFCARHFASALLVLVMTRRLFWDDEENVGVDR